MTEEQNFLRVTLVGVVDGQRILPQMDAKTEAGSGGVEQIAALFPEMVRLDGERTPALD